MKILFIFLFTYQYLPFCTSIDIALPNNVHKTLSGPELPFGYWSPFEMCKNGSYAIGFRIKMNDPGMNVFDNEALTGLELVCANKTSVTNMPRSGERREGWFSKSKWGDFHYCNKGAYLKGFSLKQQDKQGFFHDDLGAVNIQFECSDNTILKENVTYHQGYWHKWGRCPEDGAICGLSTKIDNGVFDSAGLVSANFMCCPKPTILPMPSARSLPKSDEESKDNTTSKTPSPLPETTTPKVSSIEISPSIPTSEKNITVHIPIVKINTTEATNATTVKIPLHKNSMTFDLINSLLQMHLKKLNGTISELEHRLNDTNNKKSEEEKTPYVKTIIRRNENHPNGSQITFRRIIISRTPIFTIIRNEGPSGPQSPIYVPHTVPGHQPLETSTNNPVPIYTVKDGKVVRFTVNLTHPNASESDLKAESKSSFYDDYFGLHIFFHVLAILCACLFFFLFGFLCKKIYILKFKKEKDVKNPVTLQKDVEKGDTVKIPEKIKY